MRDRLIHRISRFIDRFVQSNDQMNMIRHNHVQIHRRITRIVNGTDYPFDHVTDFRQNDFGFPRISENDFLKDALPFLRTNRQEIGVCRIVIKSFQPQFFSLRKKNRALLSPHNYCSTISRKLQRKPCGGGTSWTPSPTTGDAGRRGRRPLQRGIGTSWTPSPTTGGYGTSWTPSPTTGSKTGIGKQKIQIKSKKTTRGSAGGFHP